jgi:exosortase/archaeosortase family protein
LIKGFVFFLLWDQLLYNYLITPEMHNWVIYRLLDVSQFILKFFYKTVDVYHFDLFISDRRCVHVGIPCNGIDVMGVFAALVLAYRSKWQHKLWMIMVGVAVVFMLNAIRASALAAIILHNRQAFDINHKYIFNFVLYGLLLLIFSLWSSRFGRKTEKPLAK